MGNRNISRSIARKLYAEFSKKWRYEKNLAGKHGQPGFRKPTFNQWYAMYQRDQQMMRESTPQDVQEYLGLDPWVEQPPTPQPKVEEPSDRGVVEIPMMGEPIE